MDDIGTDHVDEIVEQWAVERPELDSTPLHVIGRISRLSDVIDEQLRPVFAAFGLGDGDFDVLATLRRNGPPFELTPTELAARTMVTSGAVSKRVDRLVGAGLVDRRVSDADGRGRHVRLTGRGQALIDEAYPVHLRNEARLLAGLSAVERDQLAALLRKAGASVDEARVPDMRT
ncbi:MarR family winged helix-turn-helix transcriptional regulator [Aeromicrobium endophyticum]|uniref:MarR family transcriptional regulator n=1 Tax=Aeromicrobium endophyticum TaxID=2292704 RepID=A0A371P3Y4_9ACTN|nr:MarR family transcriptional regulator [Aeromicrobium endophyticum]REK70657.1 MarR family transcriptional regulator [Aeromicrobium endophyticum]